VPEAVRLEYEQVNQNIRMLTDVRFKLLAFVPTISGVAITLLARSIGTGARLPGSVVLAASLLGFFTTTGIVFYDQRNSNLYDAYIGRAKDLEGVLARSGGHAGGQWAGRPPAALYLFGVVPVWHDGGLALIYASVLGAWLFSATSGLVAALSPTSVPFKGLQGWVAAGVGAAAFILFLFELSLLNNRDGKIWIVGLLRKRRLRDDLLGKLKRKNVGAMTPPPGHPKYDLGWTIKPPGNQKPGYAIALVVPLPKLSQEQQLQFVMRRILILKQRMLEGLTKEPQKAAEAGNYRVCPVLVVSRAPSDSRWIEHASKKGIELVPRRDLDEAIHRWSQGKYIYSPPETRG
jgi:hypothetical protein